MKSNSNELPISVPLSFLALKRTKKAESSQPFSFHPEGIKPPSQEPESYVISITLRVATVIVYQILENFTSKKSLPKGKLFEYYNSISPNKSAIENPV